MAEDVPLSHEDTVHIRALLAAFYREKSDAPLIEIFQLCDRNNDGNLSFKELKQLLNAVLDDMVKDSEVEAMIQRADTNQDGTVDVVEFLAAMKRTTSA